MFTFRGSIDCDFSVFLLKKKTKHRLSKILLINFQLLISGLTNNFSTNSDRAVRDDTKAAVGISDTRDTFDVQVLQYILLYLYLHVHM